MLSVKLFEEGLSTLTSEELRHVVDVVNDFLEKKTVVMTGRAVITPKGEIHATHFSTGKPKWGDNYTCLAYDIAAMGIERWEEGQKAYTKNNYFHQLNEKREIEAYKMRKELDELRAYKNLTERNNG